MSTPYRQFCYKSNELDFHPDPSSSSSHCHNFGKVSPFSWRMVIVERKVRKFDPLQYTRENVRVLIHHLENPHVCEVIGSAVSHT